MVFGPILDGLRAKREGKSLVHVWNQGQQFVNAGLPLSAKLMFWATNAPYFFLAAQLWIGAQPLAPGAQGMHAVALTVMAVVSTAFHGAAMFGSSNSPWPSRLLIADLTCANGYGLLLAGLLGFWRVLMIFAPAVLCLAAAAQLKRRRSAWGYVVGHRAKSR